jgi:hypothetical protein
MQAVFTGRREFLKAAGVLGMATAGAGIVCGGRMLSRCLIHTTNLLDLLQRYIPT